MEALNIDKERKDIEEKNQELQILINDKLTNGYGYELQDDTLSAWIIMLAVTNNKTKSEVQQDLVEFIQDNSQDFVDWLWNEAPRIFEKSKPVVEESKMAFNNFNHLISYNTEVVSDQPKTQEEPQAKSETVKKNSKPQDKQNRLFKKAIGDTQKFKNDKKSHDKGSSYVKTDKEGRKIITLGKGKPEPQKEDQKQSSKKFEKSSKGESSILNRIKTKPKDGKEASKNSKLDMSLDSIIQKEKQKEYMSQQQDWYGYGPKHSGYEVTEEEVSDKQTKPKNNYKRQKRQEGYQVEEADGKDKQEAEGDNEAEGVSKNYKGKKPNPYYNMMGYMNPAAMYGYPFMDPYMMGGYYPGYKGGSYKPKKFKNKSLVFKKDDKSKSSAPEGEEKQ